MAKSTRKAWFQGADAPSVDGEVTSNDPNKLGYPKEMGYNKKPMETSAPGGQDTRPWEQKWFEGAAAETKKVMGPQGSEFKLKQEMQRIPVDAKVANAKLSGKFTIKASPKDSFWTIYATNKKTGSKEKVLTATLEQLWGEGLSEELAYQTKDEEYIKEVMQRIRKDGFSNVAYLMTGDKSFVKTAGPMGEAAGAIGGAGVGFLAGGPVGALVGGAAGKSLMEDDELTLTVEDAAGEDAVRADVTVEELVAKKAELESAESKLIDLLPADAAELGREVQALEAEVETAIEENKTVAAKLRDKSVSASAKVKLMRIAQEAFEAAAGPEGTLPSADNALAELADKIDAVVAEVNEVTEGASVEGGEELQGAVVAPEAAVVAPEVGVEEVGEEALELTSAQINNFLSKRSEMNKAAASEEQKYGVVPDGAPKDGKGEIDAAHPKGGVSVSDLTAGTPVKNNGAKFETVTEAQDIDLAVANKMPTGELNSSASSRATVKTASASVDSETKSYWHELFDKMGPEGKKFADQLTDSYNKQVAASTAEIKGRVKRAYELAEVASTKGLVEPTSAAKSALAERITKFDDEAFVAYKEAVENTPTRRIVASETLTKTASKLPVVGQNDKVMSGGDEFEKLSSIWS